METLLDGSIPTIVAISLRRDMRIVGSFIGGQPSAPLQNRVHGLPLLLLPEQVALIETELSGSGDVLVVDDGDAHGTATAQEAEQVEQVKRDQADARAAARKSHAMRMRAVSSSMSDGIEQFEDASMQLELPPPPVSVPTSSNGFPWYRPNRVAQSASLPWRPISALPHTIDMRTLRMLVFDRLWRKGWYITSGSKFGGDFMLYKDDPALCHAMYVVHVVYPDECVGGPELTRASRLAGIAGKKFVFCTWDGADGIDSVVISRGDVRQK